MVSTSWLFNIFGVSIPQAVGTIAIVQDEKAALLALKVVSIPQAVGTIAML